MTQTINIDESAGPLYLDPVWRSTPFILNATAAEGINVYRGQLWRTPQAARAEGAEPLATAYAAVTDGEVNIAFTGTQMDMALIAGDGAYDDLWLTIASVGTDGQPSVRRADWLRVRESGADPAAFVVGGITVTVDTETNTAYFTIGGISFQMAVYEDPDVVPGEGGWEVSIVNDMAVLTKDGVSFTGAVKQV